MSAAAGAAYGLLFGYVGASFASVQYSIFPLLWVLLGGAGTVLGPFIGTLFMFYLIDLSSQVTSAYMLIAGVVLVGLTLFAPQGLAGESCASGCAGGCREPAVDPGPDQAFCRAARGEDVDFDLRQGQGAGADRAERRRQDHLCRHAVRADRADRGHGGL